MGERAAPDIVGHKAGANGATGFSVPHSTFDLQTTPEAKRFEIWKDSISCIFDVNADRDVRKNDFNATISSHLIGNMFVARTSTRRQNWARQNQQIARDGMDHYMIQLFEEGGMRADQGGANIAVRTGDIVIFDLAQECRTSTDDFCNLSVVMPRDMLSSAIDRPDDQHLRVLPSNAPGTTLLKQHILAVKDLAPTLTLAQATEINTATASLIASCINISPHHSPERGYSNNIARLATLRQIIDGELGNKDLSPAWIAKKANISRTRLYAHFEAIGGVAQYIRRRRFRRAMLMLTTDRYRAMSINEIASSCGFSNFSAFSRAFKTHFGIAPSAARRQNRAPIGSQNNCRYTDRQYEHWIQHFY